MRDHLEEFPALRPLLLVLKYFLQQRGLNETYPSGGIGSFLLQMMALSFLQHRRHAVTFAAAQSSSINGGGAAPAEDNHLGSLLMGFLELYGRRLNVDAVGISVRNKGTYFRKQTDRRVWAGGPARVSGLLCVENPLLPDVDVGKNAFNFATVRRAMAHGHMVLCEAVAHQLEASARVVEAKAGKICSSSSSTSPTPHSFSHPKSSSEKAMEAAPPPTSALASILFAEDPILLERALPLRPDHSVSGADLPQEFFTVGLPPPPQPRDGDSEDSDDESSMPPASAGKNKNKKKKTEDPEKAAAKAERKAAKIVRRKLKKATKKSQEEKMGKAK